MNSYWPSIIFIKILITLYFLKKVKVPQLCLTLCNPHGLYSPWNSPGQNIGVGSSSSWKISRRFPNPGIKSRSPALQLSHKRSPPKKGGGKGWQCSSEISNNCKFLKVPQIVCLTLLYKMNSCIFYSIPFCFS